MPLPDMGSCAADGAPCTLYAKLQYINSVLLLRTDYFFTENTLTSRQVCFATQERQSRPHPLFKVLSWVRTILSKHMCVQTVVIRSPLPPSLVEIVYSRMWWITEAILTDSAHLGDRCKWKALKRLHLETATRLNSLLLTSADHVTVSNETAVVEGLSSAVAKSVETNYLNAMALEGNTHVERLTVACKRDVHADFGSVKKLLESMTSLKEVTWMFKMDDLSTYDNFIPIIDASCQTVPSVSFMTMQGPSALCPLSDTSTIAFVGRLISYKTTTRIQMGATDADLAECGILPRRHEDNRQAENILEAGEQDTNVLSPYINRYQRELRLMDLNGIDCRFRAAYCHPQDSRCFLFRMGSDDTALVDRLDFTQCPSLTVLMIMCAQSCYPDHHSNLFHLASEYLRSPSCTLRDVSVNFCETCNRQAYGDMVDAMCVNTSITRLDSNLPITTQEQCENFARMVRLNKTLTKFSTFYTDPAEGERIDLKCVLNSLRHHNYTLAEMCLPCPFTDRQYVEIANYLNRNLCIANRAVDLINEARGGELVDEDLKLIALVPKDKLSARVGAKNATSYYNDINRKYFRLTNVSPDERFQNSDDWRQVFSYLRIQDVTGIEFLL